MSPALARVPMLAATTEIPLDRIDPGPIHVPRVSARELAQLRSAILERSYAPLFVRAATNSAGAGTGRYRVVLGQRLYAALHQLVDERAIAPTHAISCRVFDAS